MGLIRLSFHDQFGDAINLDALTFKDMKKAFEFALRDRLINLKIPDVDVVIKKMIEKLVEIQSLLVIGVV